MKPYIRKLISEVLGNMFENGQIRALPAFTILTPKENYGDYSVSVAHAIAKEGKFQPNDVAQIIADELKSLDAGYEKNFANVAVVNGFVNVFIDKLKAAEYVQGFHDNIPLEKVGADKKIVFEYSSPNTNKPLHIGHTRNDVFGMANINLLKAVGYDVVATEVINDRGIHIMKSMLMYQKYGEGKTPQSENVKPDHFVGQYYRMFAVENDKFPKPAEGELTPLEKEAQEMLKKWEEGDADVRALWRKMNDWYYEGVALTYKREGSHFDSVEHESEIYDKGRDLVLEGLEKGVFKKDETGAVYVDLTDQGLDKKYLLRKDGTTIYITQDMYLWHLRDQKFHPNEAIVVTGSEQIYHFNVLKKIFELLEFPWAENFYHLPYGFVFLGKNKISSRAGNTVTADDLVELTKEKVRQTMRNSQKIKASPEDEQTVEAIAFAAIKYGYLKFDRNTQIFFDLDETIAIEGNTGPYLQYTYARIQSILSKAKEEGIDVDAALKQAPVDLDTDAEKNLIRFLLHYSENVVEAAVEHRPNIVAAYLFDLAAKFNTFYDQVSVLNEKDENLKKQRLSMLASVSAVLRHGLSLLGISVLDKI